jgi:di/tripeptidase
VLQSNSKHKSERTFYLIGVGAMEDDKQMIEDKLLLENIVRDLDEQQIKKLLSIIHKMQKEAP